MQFTKKPHLTCAFLAATVFGFAASTASAQTELLAIEFNEDDQADFDVWPDPIIAPSSTVNFATDSSLTSGTTAVTISTSSGFGLPANRGGLVDETPAGFTNSGLYADLLHASGPTGVITLDFGGLNPNTVYRFTLYAWDPGATDGSDKEWTVTGGTGVPSVLSVNFLDPLVDNESFALVFEVTTSATGTFQVTNTNGLPQSAINGFRLEALGNPPSFTICDIKYSIVTSSVTLTWESVPGENYAVKYSTDMLDWSADLDDGVAADAVAAVTTGTYDLALAGAASNATLFFRVEKLP